MKRYLYAAALAIAATSLSPRLDAQQAAPSMQATLAKDAATLSDKFSGLARVMAGKYEWKPGPGVRSVADVFNLIVMENGILTGTITGAATGGGGRGPQITDPAKLQEALTTSYSALQKAISGLSDAELKAPVKLFGMDFTKQGAIMFLLSDQHEHLGQSIAYARSNGVVPPWSK
jgi:uncharacterized damage-inducible protein DinB